MPNRPRLSSSGKDDREQDIFRVRPGRNAGQDRGVSGGGGSGWSRGFGWGGGGVRTPPGHRMTHAGRSAGKVAAAGINASQQRCMTKLAYHGMTHASAHTRYLEREGAGLEQNAAHAHNEYLTREHGGLDHRRAEPFGPREGQEIDTTAKVQRWASEHDRYHWRMVIAPEKAPESLQDMTREVMAKAETHLGTRLDWFAVAHHGDGNPHVHIVFRGRHVDGKHLFIDPAYVKSGFRESAQQFLTREHGERSEQEIERGQERSWEILEMRRDGLERVRELAQEHGLEERDQLRLEHTMLKGSVREIEQTHHRLDALERVQEIEREIPQEQRQEMERKVLDGSQRQVNQVEKQVQQVEQRIEQVRERSRDRDRGHDMDMGL
jgi:type IV secretory pathway VirD2 relaxase